jgi:hypothetical protein
VIDEWRKSQVECVVVQEAKAVNGVYGAKMIQVGSMLSKLSVAQITADRRKWPEDINHER